MRKIEALFADYSAHHRTAGNKMCHRIGIPLIVFSLIGLLERVPLFNPAGVRFDLAMLLIAASTIYYVTLEVRLALGMLILSIGCYALARQLPTLAHVALFIAGWILQFIGHGMFEKRSPAFLRNFVHLLVGPLWILNDLLHIVTEKPVPATE